MTQLKDNFHPDKYFNHLKIAELAVEQLKKDFELTLLDIPLQSVATEDLFRHIASKISPVVNQFLERDSERFFSILYRIDVPPKDVKDFIEPEKETGIQELSEAIVKRAFEKVIFREWYAGRL